METGAGGGRFNKKYTERYNLSLMAPRRGNGNVNSKSTTNVKRKFWTAEHLY
jgi:hypothetical protein